MSRTIKSLPYSCFRRVKGHNRAIKAKLYEEGVPPIRNGAIPPDPWDDISHDDQALIPYKVAEKMLKEGKSEEFVAKRMARKFKLSYSRAMDVVKIYAKRWNR